MANTSMVEMAFKKIFFIVPPYALGFDETALLGIDAEKNHHTSKNMGENPTIII
ncbi:hypothetical protein RE628_02425 [Paenibacillus sp. D2_2]|uniref:hypothetical protein n=1 Tax=Paenibacillus sp. D2_2 TaxID=3073092 RepID=UPI002815127D|nr:hypothetical protein [Paenibacillus sp. D2_2]WMT41425.1 hypothetical protein RE628_02425 [Paenibacillus sp. D2_2]